MKVRLVSNWLAGAAWAMTLSAPAIAEMSAEELAKLAQNPVGNLIQRRDP